MNSPKVNLSFNKINLEIVIKTEEVKRLTSRIEKVKGNNSEVEKKIKEYSSEIIQMNTLANEIEKLKKRNNEIQHKNALLYKRYTSKIVEIKKNKKKFEILEKKL